MIDQPLDLREKMALGLVGLTLFLGLWTLLSVSGLVPRQFLPAPFEVIARFIQLH